MKHTYTNEQIQAAIDAACKNTITPSGYQTLDLRMDYLCWANETPARLHLAKELLERLPEPASPVVDGKTPGQVAYEAIIDFFKANRRPFYKLTAEEKKVREIGASAVLAAFGGQASLDAAIARMEAVPLDELEAIFLASRATANKDVAAVRARLIAAAREGQPSQSAEIPWTPWHGGECPLKDEEVEEWERKFVTCAIKDTSKPSDHSWASNNTSSDITAYRVLKWKPGFGPDTVDWKAKCEKAEADLLSWKGNAERLSQDHAELSKELGRSGAMWANQMRTIQELQAQLEKLEAKPQLSRLRPHSEAGPVPERCVRVTARITSEGYIINPTRNESVTHFADILLPEEKVQEPEPETFEAHGKAWICHTPGDPMPDFKNNPIIALDRSGSEWSTPLDLSQQDFWSDKEYSNPFIGWRYADEPTPKPKPSWTPKVGDKVESNPAQDMALGGQMYWRDLARQLAEVWWKCHNIGASLQHGDIDNDVSFSVVCEKHGGQVFHADTPHNAWLKAEKWLMSPDRENFPASTIIHA